MKLNRRNFLIQSLASTSVLPYLLKSTCSEAATGPKRIIFVHMSLGAVRSSWMPSGTETGFTLAENHASLAPHKQNLLILGGIGMTTERYTGNHKETGGLLTGMKCNGLEESSQHTNISVDQLIAKQIGSATRFKSLELACWDQRDDLLDKVDYRMISALGPGQKVVPEGDPLKAFNRIFTGISSGTTPQVDPVNVRRRSVLDVVARELMGLQNQLTGAEKIKIDNHLSAIREIEKSLQSSINPPPTSCSAPTKPPLYGIHDNNTIPQRLKAQMDIMTMAMACDLTRVGVLTIEGGQSRASHGFLGLPGDFHDTYTHSNRDNFAEHAKMVTWWVEQIAYMVTRLKAIPEGGGSVFDNTAIVVVSEQGCRTPSVRDHCRSDLPFMIIGNLGGYFRTGRFVQFANEDHARFLINIMNSMGIAGNTMGNLTINPLPNLT